MSDSLILLPLKLGVRTARASLHATRDLADLGLATLALVDRMLGEEPERTPAPAPTQKSRFEAEAEADPAPEPAPEPEAASEASPPPEAAAVEQEAGAEPEADPGPADQPLPEERELVEEVADPGAEDGAGASLRVAPPFTGYDELRAADLIARLAGADMAELGETELYERTHRARRTVLEAIAREIRRRPPS